MVRVALGLGCLALLAWTALAVYLSPFEPAWLRLALRVGLPIVALLSLLGLRSLRRLPAVILGAFALVLVAWLAVPPSRDRDWQPDVAVLPHADIRGDRVVVHNVRNADYRSETDYSVRLEDHELDLSWWSWRLFVNGYLDELAYDIGASTAPCPSRS